MVAVLLIIAYNLIQHCQKGGKYNNMSNTKNPLSAQYDLETDLAVIGCGFAGCMAAIAAARSGIRTLAVEEAGYPGGSMTGMGTGPMMTFHAGKTQVIRGLAEELVQRLTARGYSPGHTIDATGFTYSVTPFSSEGLKVILEEMMLESGVRLLYHTSIIGCEILNGQLTNLTAFSCGQQFPIHAVLYLDAPGDGDLLSLAGLPTVSGRDGDHANQPMTMNFRVSGVDTERIRSVMQEKPELFPCLLPKAGIERDAVRLSVSGFTPLIRQAVANGELDIDRDLVLCFETNTKNEYIINMSRINGENPLDPESLTRAEIEGRRQAWTILRFLKAHVPGFENAEMLFTGPNVGIRSSRLYPDSG